MLFLGVDPARSGSAVLLKGGPVAVFGAVWRPKARGGVEIFEVVYAFKRGLDGRLSHEGSWWSSRLNTSTLGGIGERIRDLLRELSGEAFALAGENAIVGRAADTSISVARNAGRILGPLEAGACGQQTTWVRATEWRALLLGLHHRTGREEAKTQSRAHMPARVIGLEDLVRLLGDADDLPDAAGVAEWLMLHTRDPSSVPLKGRRRKKPTTEPTPSASPKTPSASFKSGGSSGSKPAARRR